MNKVLLLGLLFVFTGCSVMHFQVAPETSGAVHKKWHHNFIFGMVETSQPVNPTQLCGEEGWQKVTTKVTFLTGLVGILDNLAVERLGPPMIEKKRESGNVASSKIIGYPIDIWLPQNVEINCKKSRELGVNGNSENYGVNAKQ